MKTNQEIRNYIRTLRASDEGNEYAIIQYCLSQFKLKVSFREPNDSMPIITFQQFKIWAERDFPTPNSVIVIEESGGFRNMISYVSCILYDRIILGASLSPTGDLITDKLSIPFDAKIKKATEKQIEKINIALSNRKFEWSFEYNRVIERFIPQIGNYVKFQINSTGKRGIGVYRKTTKEGKVIMFCVKIENEPIQHSLNDNIGDSSDLNFHLASIVEKNIFQSELKKVGKIWNGRLRRIEPIYFQVKKGKTYYFINEKFNVVPAKDSESAQDRLKFNCGNYFTNIEDAEEMIEYMIEFRKIQLARPEKNIQSDNSKDEGD